MNEVDYSMKKLREQVQRNFEQDWNDLKPLDTQI